MSSVHFLLYCILICIEPKCSFINNTVFFANINHFEAVTRLCAILYRHAFLNCSFYEDETNLLYLYVVILHNCTNLTFDLYVTLNRKIILAIHPYIVCNSPRNNSTMDAEH